MDLKSIVLLSGAFGALLWFGFSGKDTLAADQAVEVGIVDWGRNFEEALKRSKAEQKPVFAFFQEVPGCSGCQDFGKTVLSNPLIAELIESEFVPVLIYNNRGGKDAELLKRYNEPAWNYQVVRFLDHAGQDIIPRKDRIWSIPALLKRVKTVYQKTGKPVPRYVRQIFDEYANPNIKTVVFDMYCFWSGEKKLGAIDGVIRTEAGFYNSREVTLVQYDPSQVSVKNISVVAAQLPSAKNTYLENSDQKGISSSDLHGLKLATFDWQKYRTAPNSDQKRQIQNSAFTKLGLSAMQLTKVNSLIHDDKEAAFTFLSPRQLSKIRP